MSELDVLIEQLEELLDEGVTDEDDAIELAVLAGLATRLGSRHTALEAANVWRASEDGRELLTKAFSLLALEEMLDGIDDVLRGDADEEAVEDALYEFDDVVAAAIWASQAARVRDAAREVASTIREVPEPFATLAEFGVQMARLPAVAADLGLYDYWLAVADAGKWKDAPPA